MAGKLKTKNPIPYIEVLPKESLSIDFSDGEIHWKIEDINDTIIFTYDLHTKFLYWYSVDNKTNGRYNKQIHQPKYLERACEEWYTSKEKWEKVPF